MQCSPSKITYMYTQAAGTHAKSCGLIELLTLVERELVRADCSRNPCAIANAQRARDRHTICIVKEGAWEERAEDWNWLFLCIGMML
jgi:hypothetical protein